MSGGDEVTRLRDGEGLLQEVAAGCQALGVPPPPTELQLQMIDALDAAHRVRADPVREDLPPWRAAAVALLCGVAAALAEDSLLPSHRFTTRRGERWWMRGYYGTHRWTRHRFDRGARAPVRPGVRVGGVDNTEHAPTCRQHSNNHDKYWRDLGEPRPT